MSRWQKGTKQEQHHRVEGKDLMNCQSILSFFHNLQFDGRSTSTLIQMQRVFGIIFECLFIRSPLFDLFHCRSTIRIIL